MADEKNTKVEVKETAKAREQRLIETYNIRSLGRGKWTLGDTGLVYPNKTEVLKAAAALEVEDTIDDDLKDVIPKGYEPERFRMRDRSVIRGSVMELPMNEQYTPDGEKNPHYDREFVWAWGYLERQALATSRSRGYEPVTVKEFKESVKQGRIPAALESLVYDEGDRMVHGDSVLLRCPRYIWRQQRMDKWKESAKVLGDRHLQEVGSMPRDVPGTRLTPEMIERFNLGNETEIVEV